MTFLMCMHACKQHECVYKHIRILFLQIPTNIHTYKQTDKHTYIHTYIHINKLKNTYLNINVNVCMCSSIHMYFFGIKF